jgi:tRNA-specific 2-thiouridylase
MKIALGISGGVDSAVALYLLKNQGYDVTAFHMQCWDYKEEICTGEKDKADAAQVCSQLGVPFKFLDFQKEYQEKVISNFYSEYAHGRTPNPDVLCNLEIKFGLFFDYAMKNGFDAVATGHYAKVFEGKLFQPKDLSKDQTYFLYRIQKEKLTSVIFPLSDLLKTEVKEIAKKAKLKVAEKAESMGICFIGKVSIKEFLKKRISENPGQVLDTKVRSVGRHIGVPFYTIGQRHGFEINAYIGTPMYVISKDAERNILVVGNEEEAKSDIFSVSDLNLLADADFFENFYQKNPHPLPSRISSKIFCRIRHLGELYNCQLYPNSISSSLDVKLDKKVFGVAPGQSCVFYSSEGQVLGGGIIN